MNHSHSIRANFRKALNSGRPQIGCWQLIPSAQITEAQISMDGLSWAVLDMEHGLAQLEDAEAFVLACERYSKPSFVRLPNMDPYLARRLLDLGLTGIILPVVESVSLYKQFTQHLSFPPAGRRGVALTRSNLWGVTLEEDVNSAPPIVIPMIETSRGIEEAPQIITDKSTDAVIIGPYDLSCDLGHSGNFEHENFVDAALRLKIAAKNANKPIGIHQVEPDLAQLAKRISDGFQLIAYGVDIVAIRRALRGVYDVF